MTDLISRDAIEKELANSCCCEGPLWCWACKATRLVEELPAAPAPQPRTEEQLAEAMYDDTHFAGGWRTSTQVERELCFAHARVALAGPVKP